jgi:hypothetical protein
MRMVPGVGVEPKESIFGILGFSPLSGLLRGRFPPE